MDLGSFVDQKKITDVSTISMKQGTNESVYRGEVWKAPWELTYTPAAWVVIISRPTITRRTEYGLFRQRASYDIEMRGRMFNAMRMLLDLSLTELAMSIGLSEEELWAIETAEDGAQLGHAFKAMGTGLIACDTHMGMVTIARSRLLEHVGNELGPGFRKLPGAHRTILMVVRRAPGAYAPR